MAWLAIPGAIVATFTVVILSFKLFKASVRFIIAIDTLIRSIEENTKAHKRIGAEVGRFRKVTQKSLADIKQQHLGEVDYRLDEHEEVLSVTTKKAG